MQPHRAGTGATDRGNLLLPSQPEAAPSDASRVMKLSTLKR